MRWPKMRKHVNPYQRRVYTRPERVVYSVKGTYGAFQHPWLSGPDRVTISLWAQNDVDGKNW